MDTQIEQLNLSSITKFALTYAGITTVSELKEYNYISLANVLPRNCSLLSLIHISEPTRH